MGGGDKAENFEKERAANDSFKEGVELSVGTQLAGTLAQLQKLESNNLASEAEIQKHTGDIQALTGVITHLTTVAAGLKTRFQSVETNVAKILAQKHSFDQNIISIQNQLSVLASGTVQLPIHPGYLGAPPRITPYTLTPGSPPSPMTWENASPPWEEIRNSGNIPPAPDESGGGGVL